MTRKKQAIYSCILLLATFLIFGLFYSAGDGTKTKKPVSGTDFQLNTVIQITLYDPADEALIQEAFELCAQYEALFSRTLPSSEIYQLNEGTLLQDATGFLLSSETAELIQKGLDYSRLSQGRFDITIGPVSRLWDFTSGAKTVPDKEQIAAALSRVNYQNVTLDGNHLQFAADGMALDLGAIAKGYIADRLKDFLLSKGVKSATINLGGNVLCIGAKPDGSPFNIGIQKPFADRSETIGTVRITDQSVVSSGIYERCFEKDGRLYHHILDPSTGYPCDNNLVSVTIISDQSVDGDGLSTACFALGLEKGMALIESLPDAHALFITRDGQLHYSKNFPIV